MKHNSAQDLIERPVVQIAMLLHSYLYSLQSLETCKGISTDAVLHMGSLMSCMCANEDKVYSWIEHTCVYKRCHYETI